jgi:uncharacterized protein
MSEEHVAALARWDCISLTTFRPSGAAIATPVWFVLEGPCILVWTFADRGKVKRIRRDPRVTVAPCTYRGRPTGAAFAATARLLPPSDGPRVQALLGQKYGLRKRLYDQVNAIQGVVRRHRSEPVYLEIMPTEKGHCDGC